jgi:hypothetical protein
MSKLAQSKFVVVFYLNIVVCSKNFLILTLINFWPTLFIQIIFKKYVLKSSLIKPKKLNFRDSYGKKLRQGKVLRPESGTGS